MAAALAGRISRSAKVTSNSQHRYGQSISGTDCKRKFSASCLYAIIRGLLRQKASSDVVVNAQPLHRSLLNRCQPTWPAPQPGRFQITKFPLAGIHSTAPGESISVLNVASVGLPHH
jgi:hypothetical protein